MTNLPPKFKEKREIEPIRETKRRLPMLLIGVLIFGFFILAYKGTDFLRVNKDGEIELVPERLDKLQKELNALDEAEQYALRAMKAGEFPCLNCSDSLVIHLKKDEIWKYGVTSKGEAGRYGRDLAKQNLYYDLQFTGDYTACLKQEKIKIYAYALLPENLKRITPLIRPPGNKIDK